MHPSFAKRLAGQIHERKWKYGWKPHHLATWLIERFPNLTVEDQQLIKTFQPKSKA